MAPKISIAAVPWARWNVRSGRALALTLLVLAAVIYPTFGDRAWERLNLRNLVFDFYQRLSPRQLPRFPVVVVDIDDESLAAFGRWPWPRTRIASLVMASRRLGARAIGLDMIMPEPDNQSPHAILAERLDAPESLRAAITALPSNDAILAETLRRVPSVIGRAAMTDATPRDPALAQTPVVIAGAAPNSLINNEQRYAGQLLNIPEIEAAARGHGYLNDSRDRDGIIRFMPVLVSVHQTVAPSFAVELIRMQFGQRYYQVHSDKSAIKGIQIGDFFAPLDADGRLRLYFSSDDGQRRVSAAKILRGEMAPGAFADRIAIVGISAVGTGDLAPTPIAARMDGVEIQAQTIDNILSGTHLTRPIRARWIEAVALLGLGLMLIFILSAYGPLRGAAVFFGGVVLLFLASYGSFHWVRELYDPTFPLAASSAIVLLLLIAGFSEAQQLRRESEAALELARTESLKMAGELRAAGKIQKGMLPDPRAIKGLPRSLDFFAMLEPAQEVGGDLYDAFMLDEHRLCFMIGDVSDKGVPAALFMAVTKA
ncbi:MAG TPA: CHASE2 domain-containing protein, partial [Burkholderiales bacterium]|nr:CHASE2 domain-containing protein [Burkholderiales bacterium]